MRAHLKPSAKRVDALWNTHALSTPSRKASAAAASSVTMQSVWLLPLAWM